ncbi:MAG TPA: hypothetical protein VKU82_04175 [Planctomycetaceae bacterium]|nr:hypothetical protein [Planctomycetaceae bacterium]
MGVAATLAAGPANRPTISVIRDQRDRPAAFEATGLSTARLKEIAKRNDADAWAEIFSMHVIDEPAVPDQPAIVGTYSVDGSSLRFTPRYALRPGMRYRAVLHLRPLVDLPDGDSTEEIALTVAVPEAVAGRATEVTQVYPSAEVLPENQLRFYIHFSAPMAQGEAYEHLRLVNSDGMNIDQPFLELSEELWDRTGRRLTLLIDPGRIKREVKPRLDAGPVLAAGREYTLVIERGWRDAMGQALKGDFKKRFRAGPPVDAAIEPAEWKVDLPAAGSREPLRIKLPRPLDHALLERTIAVADEGGKMIGGRITVGDEERRWEFRPEGLWSSGRHQIVIDTTLEDLAGNRIGHPFEVDEVGPIRKTLEAEMLRIPFEVLAPPAKRLRQAGF